MVITKSVFISALLDQIAYLSISSTTGGTATNVKANFNGGQIATTAQLATSYGHEGEETTTTTKTVLTTGKQHSDSQRHKNLNCLALLTY